MRSSLRRALPLPTALCFTATAAAAQASGNWPPDSLVNTRVIPRSTSPTQVWGTMRTIAAGLGVACTYCHIGRNGAPLAEIDFASDQKRSKLVARQMMVMTRAINGSLDSIPDRGASTIAVTCASCHRGVARPVPLATLVADAAIVAGADSALRAYRGLRARYYGRDAFDFGEPTLNVAAYRAARAGRIDDGLALLRENLSLFPGASALHVFRGNILLMRQDTAVAADAFREAILRDAGNDEARARLRDIGRQ